MGHDATKVVFGATKSSFKEVTNHPGAIAAGLAVVADSNGALSTTLSAGSLLGVSLGLSLSDTSRSSVVRRGAGVPIVIDAFTPTIGAQVQIHATSGIAVASGTAVNAYYVSSKLNAIKEDGTVVTDGCALIDFPGGL